MKRCLFRILNIFDTGAEMCQAPKVEKGLEHWSIAPKRKWTEGIMAEEFGQVFLFINRAIYQTFTDIPKKN